VTDSSNTENEGTLVETHSRVQRIQGWLRRRSENKLARLSWQWFRSYLAASRNSACAISIYSCLSVVPAALMFIAVVYNGSGNVNVFAQHLVDHLRLSGDTATLVQQTFGSASSNALAASIATLVSFLLWGIGIGQIYQNVYAKAWEIEVGSLADQALYTIFFFVLSAAVAGVVIAQAELGHGGSLAVLFVVGTVGSLIFWLVVPYYLLHRQISYRQLLPGALMATILIAGTMTVAPLFLPATLAANGRAFGAFGISLTVVGYLFTLITMSVASAVFSPVWLSWREAEKIRVATE
jgi:membrane protein